MDEDILLKINKIEIHNAEIIGILNNINIKMESFSNEFITFKDNLDKYGCMSGKERGEKLNSKINKKIGKIYWSLTAITGIIISIGGLIYKFR